MAVFNPDVGGVPNANMPDSTGASRGAGPDKSFEALFSGLGEGLTSAVQTADNFMKNSIEDDARYGFEALNDESNLSVSTVPQDILNSQEGLTKLAQAHVQGKVTQEYYYSRLASQLKGLRAKYPGYEKEVDDIVQKVTGTRPANAFRDALMANIERANAAVSSSQDKFQSFVTNSSNIGYIQMAFPDYFENPSKYTPEQVIAGVAKLKGQDQTWESQKLAVTANKEDAQQLLNERLNTQTSDLLSGVSNGLGVGGADFMSRLAQYSKAGGMTPDEKSSFTNTYEQFMFQARAHLEKTIADPTFVKLFTPQERQQQVEAAMRPLTQIRDLINNDQYDQAAIVIARNNNLQNRAKQALYKADPRLLGVDALSKISPEAAQWLTQQVIAEGGGNQSFFDKVALTDIMAGVIGGDDTVNQATQRIVNNRAASQAEKNSQAASLVTKFTGTIKSGTLTPEELRRVVMSNYATGDDDIFRAVDTSTDAKGNSQYLRLYNEMFSPEITKRIQESGDAQALKAYTDAAVDKFQTIPEWRRAAADLTENIDYSKFARVRYDESANRLVLEADQRAIDNLGFFQGNDQKLYLQRMVRAKDAFNQAISIIAPIAEANGGSETQFIKDQMRSIALDLQSDNREGFFWWLNSSLDGATRALTDTVEEAARGGSANPEDAKPQFEEIGDTETGTLDTGSLSFNVPDLQQARASGDNASVLNLLGRAEGTDRGRGYDETLGYGAFTGGDIDITNMTLDEVDRVQGDMLAHPNNSFNSSALGRYQIVRKTLRSLRRELGLDGSEKFTPELQDRLAQALLERRGLNKWKAGELSDQQFMKNLALEWASLPTASGGSAYGGRARVRPSEVLTAFAE